MNRIFSTPFSKELVTEKSNPMKKISTNWLASVSLIITVAVAGMPLAARAAPEVTAWGSNLAYAWGDRDQTNVPSGLSNVVAIAAGADHSLALLRQPTVPTPQLELSRGLSGLELQAQGAPGISCLLLRASYLPGPWLPAAPVTFTNSVQLLRPPDTTEAAQFFRLLRK